MSHISAQTVPARLHPLLSKKVSGMRVLYTEKLGSLRFRSVAGQRVVELYQQLSTTLDRQLSAQTPQIKSLFARPSINRRKGVVEWITDLPGNTVSQFTNLDEEAQQNIISQLAPLLSLVGSAKDKVKSDQAGLIDVLTEYPRSEDIFVVDGQPVLINWGCEPREGTTETVGLFNAVPSAPLPPAPREPGPETVYFENRRSWSWLRALLLLLLLFLLLAFLVRGCERIGFRAPMPDLMGALPSLDVSIPAPRIELEQNLRAEIGSLNAQLRDSVAACTAEPITNADERLLQQGISTGVVNVALIWNNRHDLDLMVVDPNGEEIYFLNKKSNSGGYLDIDMNASASQRTGQPIENIKWDGDEPPAGRYQVFVIFYQEHADDQALDPTPFTLAISVRGQTEEVSGTISSAQYRTPIKFHEFTVE
jgi:hypothetical protein